MKRYQLDIRRPPNAPIRQHISEGCYRVVVRTTSDRSETLQLALGGNYFLHDEEVAIAERHLAARSGLPSPRLQLKKREPDVEIEDDGVSRTHAMLFYDGVSLSIVDLMSTNGSFVNEVQVHDSDLQTGDVIKVGSTEMVVVDVETLS